MKPLRFLQCRAAHVLHSIPQQICERRLPNAQRLHLNLLFQPLRRNLRKPDLLIRRQGHKSYLKRLYSTKPSARNLVETPSDQLSISQRFRKLSREYGWSAMGIYLALSALDFPFCFAAVQWLGVERIGHAERVVVEGIRRVIPTSVKDAWQRFRERRMQLMGKDRQDGTTVEKAGTPIAEIVDDYDHGVIRAEQDNRSENASIWTQLAVAYAIHKSFIFIRLPITVAITPKVVKVLRGWGWQIGKRRPRR